MALPGCYCMYRWEALKGEPIKQFFKLINEQKEPTLWEANEYLVEDRLLTNNVYYQKGKGYSVDFVMDAPAWTDGPSTAEMLMKQRRRWSNGFFFGEMNTLLNAHNALGWNGQTHTIGQRLKMMLYIPFFCIERILFSWTKCAIMLTQMKYMLVYAAYAHFDNEYYKLNYPDAYKFFTNDSTSMGF